jgi:site-specific DNA recombinase
VCQTFQYGYIKPRGAKTDTDVQKDPAAEPIYDEWFTRLEKGDSYAEIADWLNDNGIPTGPWCDKEKWDGQLVSKVTHNPILKGYRQRNQRVSRRVNKTGRHRSEKAPENLHLYRHAPHLAFIEPERYDRVIKLLSERNGHYRRKGENGKDSRAGISKKRTRWPGQHIFCGVCGRPYLWGGNGTKNDLMCQGAKLHRCWLGVACDGPLAAAKIADAVFQEIERLPDFDEAFVEAVNAEAKRLDGDRAERLAQLSGQGQKVRRDISHLVSFIRGGDSSPHVREELARLEEQLTVLRAEEQRLEKLPSDAIEIPPVAEIKTIARAACSELAKDSPEFGKVMKLIIPKIVVFPFRLCDGGHIVLRASFRLRVSNLLPDKRSQEALQQPLERVLRVDLFDPPQREACRRRILEMRSSRLTERQAAKACHITITAAQRAAGLQRRMDARALTDPYIAVPEPPDDYSKFRRHKHKRYRFEQLEGAGEF